MNKRGNPCPKCLPFCGKVLIDDVWSGGNENGVDPETKKKYPTMSYAISKGLYHPRCKDSHTTYFPGISTADDTWTKKELEDIGLKAKQEARQQYAERQAEKFDRLAKYSLDKENKDKYGAKHDAWSKIANSSLPIQAITNPSEHSSKTLDKYFGKSVVKSKNSGIIISGARILNPDSDAGVKFAEMYYDEIRSFSTDVEKIAKNMEKSEKDIKQIKNYLFESGFEPDCAIAQSWQRLMNGKDVKTHDKTLIEHELLEMKIKKENPEIEHWKAHEIATKKYNYQREAAEYYGSLKKHK